MTQFAQATQFVTLALSGGVLTGSGTIQEQFLRYLGDTPQFKKTVATESTTTPMSEEKLVELITSHFS